MGDYGSVNKDTGVFEREGNVYADDATMEVNHPPQEGAEETIMRIFSDNAESCDLQAGPHL